MSAQHLESLVGDVDSRLQLTGDLARVHSVARERGGFDVVVCSSALCALPRGAGEEEEEEAAKLLASLAACVAPAGVVLLATPQPAPGGQPRGLLLLQLQRRLRRAGLEPLLAQPPLAPPDIDLDTFEPAPASTLLLACVRAAAPLASPHARLPQRAMPTALVIHHAAGAAAWRQLPMLARHLVAALEGPHCFDAGVHLVVDNGAGSDAARDDVAALRRVCSELASDGVVDTVIYAADAAAAAGQPTGAAAAVAALNARWFGVQSPATHAAAREGGEPVYSLLRAMELLAADGGGGAELALVVDSRVLVRRGAQQERGVGGGGGGGAPARAVSGARTGAV